MNQPTREEFERLEAEQKQLKEEVRKLKEQQTEPIKVTRIEIEQKDINLTLDNHTALLQELSAQGDLHTAGFGQVMSLLNAHTVAISGVQADVAAIKATLSDHGEMLTEVLAWVRKQKGE